MDKLYNIQQLKEWTADKILVLDISKAIKLLSEIEQSLDDTIIWKFQAENNIHLKYTPMENQLNVIDRRITTLYFTMELGSRMIQYR